MNAQHQQALEAADAALKLIRPLDEKQRLWAMATMLAELEHEKCGTVELIATLMMQLAR